MSQEYKCPVCQKGTLVEGDKSYLCNHFKSQEDKCSFRVFKSYFKKDIDDKILAQLSQYRETVFFDDLLSKEDKKFTAKLAIIDGFIRPVFKEAEKPTVFDVTCPRCDKTVLKTSKGYACEDYFNNKQCDFYLSNKIAGVAISDDEARLLMNGGTTLYHEDFESSNGNIFGAKLKLDEDCKLIFDNTIAKCPKCKSGEVYSGVKGYGCSNFKDEEIKCDFVIWKQIKGADVDIKTAEKICSDGQSEKMKFKQKDKEDYQGILKLDNNNTVIVEVV